MPKGYVIAEFFSKKRAFSKSIEWPQIRFLADLLPKRRLPSRGAFEKEKSLRSGSFMPQNDRRKWSSAFASPSSGESGDVSLCPAC